MGRLVLSLNDMIDLWILIPLLAKLFAYMGILTASGAVFCRAIFGTKPAIWHNLSVAMIGIIGVAMAYLFGGAMLTGELSGMFDGQMLQILWSSNAGSSVKLALVGLAILVVGLFLGGLGLWLSCAGALLAIGSFGVSGHIANQEDAILRLILFAHLVAIAFWVGILQPLTQSAKQIENLDAAAALGERFGNVAAAVVPLLIIAGLVMAYRLTGSFESLIATDYGQALIAKVFLVAGLLTIAAFNKLRFVPAIGNGDVQAAQKLRRAIAGEQLVFISIFALTAYLTTQVGSVL